MKVMHLFMPSDNALPASLKKACSKITPEVISSSCVQFPERLSKLIYPHGGHFALKFGKKIYLQFFPQKYVFVKFENLKYRLKSSMQDHGRKKS